MYDDYGTIILAVSFVVIAYGFYVMNSGESASATMVNSGLLFISNITKAQSSLTKVTEFAKQLLYIKVKGSAEGFTPVAAKEIFNFYTKATATCNNLDVRLILKPSEPPVKINTNHAVDIILYDSSITNIEEIKACVVKANNCISVQPLDLQSSSTLSNDNTEDVKKYDYVVLGGTFDRLHNGHKILLSQAVLRTNKQLTVGVTDVNMIQYKKLYELIEPVEKRVKSVLDFLTDINPDIDYNVLPIQDMYGPTKDDPILQMIVVSEETIRGADKINELRKQKNLPLLEKYVIGLAEDSRQSDEEEAKVSSSNQRMRLLGTLLKPVQPNPRIPDWPYVIGLSGGIASGKSTIAKRLQQKGAAILNCDLIAHELYEPGRPLNRSISKEFGDDVLLNNGQVDRAKLGQIVFSDKSKLEHLNKLVWPAVIEEAQRRIQALGQEGYRVVVMEAAVMLRAGWNQYVHQLWSTIIPPEEAIKRLQERNNLTEEQARQRIESQPSNVDQVAAANIVFSPYWSYEHTTEQVNRAWDLLQEYLRNRKPVQSNL